MLVFQFGSTYFSNDSLCVVRTVQLVDKSVDKPVCMCKNTDNIGKLCFTDCMSNIKENNLRYLCCIEIIL